MTARADVDPLLASEAVAASGGEVAKTIESCDLSVRMFTDWCGANGRPTDPARQSRADVEDFIAHVLATRSRGTAGVRYRSLRQWFKWLAAEDEVDDPMVGMSHPKLEEKPPPIIPDDHLRALLEVTKGREFNDRRDHAIIRILIDTGMRREELASLNVTDVDLDNAVILLQRSKTGTGRLVPIGTKAVAAIDRYRRRRGAHAHAASPRLWLGWRGPFTGEGIRQMLMARCKEARIPQIHPHQFRHTAAHRWLLAGGQEQDLARIAGWTPGSAILARYGASAAAQRAKVAHQRIAPGDSL
jgi:site-specific recombinase XerD